MADQLQFRGGTTSEVSAASVASREIIIDTQTNEIAVGTSKVRTVMQESNGDVEIGTINTSSTTTSGASLSTLGKVTVQRTNASNATDRTFKSYKGATETFATQADGTVLIGGDLTNSVSPSPNISLNASGSAAFTKQITSTGSLTAWADGIQMFSPSSGVGTIAVASNASAGAGTLTFQSGSTETLRINTVGDVSLGGTLPSSPNIELSAAGSGEFVGLLSAGPINTSQASASALGVSLSPGGLIRVQRPSTASANTAVFQAYNGSTSNISLYSGGAAQFAGSVSIGGSAAANTIDEYEEGTWTPVINNANAAYTTQTGGYVRVGNQVTVFAALEWTTNDAISPFFVTGLPFSTSGAYSTQVGSLKFISTLSGAPADLLYPYIETFSTSMYIRYIKTNGDNQTNWSIAQNCNGKLRFNLTYIIP